MAANLEQKIADAGSPQTMLWESQSPPIVSTPVTPEFTNWRDEQLAWRSNAVLYDQSHHLADLNIRGKDALKLIRDTAINSVEYFPVDAAKQYVAVNEEGQLIGDNILFRYEEDEFQAVGIPPTINWLQYHAETGGYDVELVRDNPSYARKGNPLWYRYEIQGPGAFNVIRELIGGEPPDVKFFHGTRFTIAGKMVRALRHGMAGEPGFEFVGPWVDHEIVRAALLAAGKKHDMIQVGGRAYLTNSLESGWLPRPLPAFYAGKSTEGFRKWLPADEIDANVSLGGSFFSENIEDYCFSPYDVGYGKIVKFDHDFVGRTALEAQVAAGQTTANRKVTLQWNGDDVAKAWASMYQPGVGAKFINLPIAHYATYHYDRVEAPDGSFRGRSLHTGYSANYRSMLSIAVVDATVAEPGTELVVVWGEPKPSSKVQVENHVQFKIRATVHPAPIDAHARTSYRKNA
ncbi:aminomethyl transferase family protein [Mesorhizobium sp. VK24D]|uniref:Aminomethyl transferase family protein n=1 Tax=Mesorhizobium album TaxID=3072314 RepID=A0ABU4XYY0_9HYPH|nr:aminomethyl transferase family protein [Mesorhizobium sp. VK24D]MDX8479892.1 aminomethyl transferase family protein [Mesorhizobium sp. VK24D]